MNRLTIAVSLLSLALVSCSHARRRDDPVMHEPASEECKERCAVDKGIDADPTDCLTECAVATDTMTHHLDEGLEDFVDDESHNEKGGEEMREVHNEQSPEEVVECAPEPGYDAETHPDFATLDTNGDGVIDADEAFAYSEKACVPDEITEQIFSETDLNQDKVISKEEFEGGGEDTVNENAMDDALEEVSEGDDESNTVQNPPMTEFDTDNSGGLDKDEANEMFEHELERRTEHEPVPEETMKEVQPKIDEAIDEVDTNDDGVISGDEFVATPPPEEEENNDLGGELQEAAAAEEDAPEIDDLSRAGAPAPAAAAAGLLAHHRQLRQGRGLQARQTQHKQLRHGRRLQTKHKNGRGLQAKHTQRKMKYAEAMIAEAKRQQRLRKVAFAQHESRLRRARLTHEQARHRSGKGRRALRHRK